jgi:hypothetical protein
VFFSDFNYTAQLYTRRCCVCGVVLRYDGTEDGLLVVGNDCFDLALIMQHGRAFVAGGATFSGTVYQFAEVVAAGADRGRVLNVARLTRAFYRYLELVHYPPDSLPGCPYCTSTGSLRSLTIDAATIGTLLRVAGELPRDARPTQQAPDASQLRFSQLSFLHSRQRLTQLLTRYVDAGRDKSVACYDVPQRRGAAATARLAVKEIDELLRELVATARTAPEPLRSRVAALLQAVVVPLLCRVSACPQRLASVLTLVVDQSVTPILTGALDDVVTALATAVAGGLSLPTAHPQRMRAAALAERLVAVAGGGGEVALDSEIGRLRAVACVPSDASAAMPQLPQQPVPAEEFAAALFHACKSPSLQPPPAPLHGFLPAVAKLPLSDASTAAYATFCLRIPPLAHAVNDTAVCIPGEVIGPSGVLAALAAMAPPIHAAAAARGPLPPLVSSVDFDKQLLQSFAPKLQWVRTHRTTYGCDADAENGARDKPCAKEAPVSKIHTPGVISGYCGHGHLVFFKMLVLDRESPRVVLELLRDHFPPEVLVELAQILYDNGCNLAMVAMRREAAAFLRAHFVIDRLHRHNHRACSPVFDINLFDRDLDLFNANSQAAEQSHSRANNLRTVIAHSTIEHAFALFTYSFAMQKVNKLLALNIGSVPYPQRAAMAAAADALRPRAAVGAAADTAAAAHGAGAAGDDVAGVFDDEGAAGEDGLVPDEVEWDAGDGDAPAMEEP